MSLLSIILHLSRHYQATLTRIFPLTKEEHLPEKESVALGKAKERHIPPWPTEAFKCDHIALN
jgi:hypothetical protein